MAVAIFIVTMGSVEPIMFERVCDEKTCVYEYVVFSVCCICPWGQKTPCKHLICRFVRLHGWVVWTRSAPHTIERPISPALPLRVGLRVCFLLWRPPFFVVANSKSTPLQTRQNPKFHCCGNFFWDNMFRARWGLDDGLFRTEMIELNEHWS